MSPYARSGFSGAGLTFAPRCSKLVCAKGFDTMESTVKPKKKAKKIHLITLAVLAALLLGLLAFAGNFLFEFALYPEASFTMSDLFRRGNVTGIGDGPEIEVSDEIRAWNEYAANAREWYAGNSESAELTASDGALRRGRMVKREGHLYALSFHGYTGSASDMAPYAKAFYDLGFSVLTPDALAHGDSEGKYIGMGWLERPDVLDWIGSIVSADPEAQIVLHGVSMGGATVMMAAGEDLPENVKCIVEDCGYSSVWDEFRLQLKNVFHMPAFPLLYAATLMSKLRAGYSFGEASSVEQLKRASVPILFIHGEADTFVPFEMLDTVFEACASAVKEKLPVPNAAHGAACATAPRLYWETVENFVSRFTS